MKTIHGALAALATIAIAFAAHGGAQPATSSPAAPAEDASKAPAPVERIKPDIVPLGAERVYLLVFADKTYAYTRDNLGSVDFNTIHKPFTITSLVSNLPLPKGEKVQAMASLAPTPIKDDGTRFNPAAFYRQQVSTKPGTTITWVNCAAKDAVYVDGFRISVWAINPPGCPDPRDP